MRIRHFLALTMSAFLSHSLSAKEILVGVDFIPIKKMAVLFTPLVLTDPISAKLAFEYKLHRKFNLVIPVETKWMNYRWAIKLGGKLARVSQNIPEDWYRDSAQLKPGWNIDYSHIKVSSGLGIKYFPFSESMTNAFFIKTIAMAGGEKFNAFAADGIKEGVVLSHAFTLGYNWVKGNVFTFGFEAGEEWSYHTNPIDNLPRPFYGFSPMVQFSLGFTL